MDRTKKSHPGYFPSWTGKAKAKQNKTASACTLQVRANGTTRKKPRAHCCCCTKRPRCEVFRTRVASEDSTHPIRQNPYVCTLRFCSFCPQTNHDQSRIALPQPKTPTSVMKTLMSSTRFILTKNGPLSVVHLRASLPFHRLSSSSQPETGEKDGSPAARQPHARRRQNPKNQ